MTEDNCLPLFYFIYFLFFGYPGSSVGAGFSLVVENRAYALVVVHGLLSAEASLVVEHKL